MKRRHVSLWLFMVVLLMFFPGLSMADLPEPIISLDFNGNWTSSGSAGTDFGSVVQNGGVEPQFGTGILSECFDQTSGQFDEVGGAVVYGDTVSQTPVQSALSGLMSFTVTMAIKMPAGVYGDPNHAGSILFSALDSNGDHAIAITTDRWNRLSLIVNNQIETDPFGEVGVHWLGQFDQDQWAFFALSYDGTVDPGSNPFDVQNVVCHSGIFSGTLHPRTIQNTSYYGVLFEGAVANVTDLAWVGNTADTATRWVYDEVEDEFIMDYDMTSEYPATFAGKLEALKIFGSKTDASGVLTKEQIEQVRSNIISEVCGSYLNPSPLGDLTGDCEVDLDDFAKLANGWMTDIRP